MTASAPAPVGAPRRSTPAARPTFRLLARTLTVIGAWVAGIMATAVVVVPWIVLATGNEPFSMMSMLTQGPRWFMFVMGIVLVSAHLGPHVAAGMTRRSFVSELTVALVGAALVLAALITAGFAVEHRVHTGLGWSAELLDNHVFTAGDQVGLVLLENAAVTPALAVSGMLVGATYYRLGGWRGTLLLPLTVGAGLQAGAILQVEWVGEIWSPAALTGLPLAVRTVVVAVVVAMVAATHVTLRRVHVRHDAS